MTATVTANHTEILARRPVYAKVMWRLIPLLILCYAIAYLDRVNVGFAKLQMLSDLKFSETVYGLGAGMFFVGYVLFEVPSNFALLRVGPRIWISRVMVTWGIISALTMYVTTPFQFYGLRFLLGVAEAGFIPAILYYLTIWFTSAQRAKATAIYLTGLPLSGILGGPVSGWIMTSLDGFYGFAGWQWMFLLEALPAVLLGIVCFFRLDDDVASAKWLTASEKEKIAADMAEEAASKPFNTKRHGLLSGRVWLMAFTYFFFTAGLYGMSFWLPSIIRDSGVKNPLDVGLLTAIPYSAALISMYLVGRSSDAMRERRWHLALPAIAGAAGLALSVLYSENTVLAIAALTVAAAGIVTCIPQYLIIPPAYLHGAAAAIGLALINSVGNISGFIGPYLLGWIKDFTGSTNIGVLFLAGALVIGALLVFANPARVVNR
jgi:sugar phosphate permease